MPEKKTFTPVPSESVCEIYRLLFDSDLVSFPLAKDSTGKVSSLVSNITGSYFGKEIYATSEEKAVAYLYYIIKDHPFIDGNKRTASLVFETLCAINDLNPQYHYFSLDSLAVFIEHHQPKDRHAFIAALAEILFSRK